VRPPSWVRASRVGRAIIVLQAIVVLSVLVSTTASGDVWTWTSQVDFSAGALTNLDSSSSPGSLRLNSSSELFRKSPANPVLSPGPPGSWDQSATNSVSVLFDAGFFKMWYAGCSGSVCGIGYATSPDGTNWTKDLGNPVIPPGSPGSWDYVLQNPHVLKDGSSYKIWFSANGPSTIQLGYATSSDGVTWAKYPSPVLSGQTWDAGAVSTPVVIREGALLTLWYSGHSGDYAYRIGKATSIDGISWTRDPSNPIMSPLEPWEESRVHPMQVILQNGSYELYYYAGFNYVQIGHAISPDGTSWSRSPVTPVLAPGPGGSWDGASLGVCTVIVLGHVRWMWYSGSDGSTRRIGLARSPAYAPIGSFVSKVVDSGWNLTRWDIVEWTATLPVRTAIAVSVRVGNVSQPDASWSGWSFAAYGSPASLAVPRARYFQIAILLSSEDGAATPTLEEVRVTYMGAPQVAGDLTLWILLAVLSSVGAVLVGLAVWFVRQGKAQTPPSPGLGSSAATTLLHCPACGTLTTPGALFCIQCGRALKPPGLTP